jgi:hypothetical protein
MVVAPVVGARWWWLAVVLLVAGEWWLVGEAEKEREREEEKDENGEAAMRELEPKSTLPACVFVV